ncbi:amidase [Streptosporangium sp. NPDC002544]|uniref:amidase n=1 Tax=Streptosporangium sp. NPDC002544 TaxID=3154538 RepID=UPI0033319303
MDEPTWLDATGQADLVRRGEISATELVDHAIARIDELNPTINAVIHTSYDTARKAAADLARDAPFAGVPFLVKDLFQQSAGDPYHYGTRFLRDLDWRGSRDTWMVSRLREAGFMLLGRTNTPEIGAWTTTEPDSYGPTRNPWDTSRSPGGSSGGSAAAVASGMVSAAHANDGGGSVRIPSSACGLVGLKPTRGRISLGPELGEAWAGFTHESAVTRSVRDIAGILDAVGGMAPGDPYTAPRPYRPYREEVGADPGTLRVGLLATHPTTELDQEVVDAVQAAGHLLENLGHVVEEAHPEALFQPAEEAQILMPVFQALDLHLWGKAIGRPITADDLDQDNWALAELGKDIPATTYLEGLHALHAWCRRMAGWWNPSDQIGRGGGGGYDLLLTPTLPKLPAPLGELRPVPGAPLAGFMKSGEYVGFTAPFNATGQPAISLPTHWSAEGLPVGIQLVAPYGREDFLIRVAAQIEEALPWSHRRPRISASTSTDTRP